jgi:hypothetical protein
VQLSLAADLVSLKSRRIDWPPKQACAAAVPQGPLQTLSTISARGVSFPLSCVLVVGGVRAGLLLVGGGQRAAGVGGSGCSGEDVQEREVGCVSKAEPIVCLLIIM